MEINKGKTFVRELTEEELLAEEELKKGKGKKPDKKGKKGEEETLT